MPTALFVCLHNAGRSQISAALFERAAAGRHHALSAALRAKMIGLWLDDTYLASSRGQSYAACTR